MKRLLPIIFFLFLYGSIGVHANPKPDFIIKDIIAKGKQFIQINIQNRSTANFPITAELKEKIFLTIFINNIKRADYKIKYLDKKLFYPNGNIFFRTNFRMKKGLKVKVEINRLKIIPESNYLNNHKFKQF